MAVPTNESQKAILAMARGGHCHTDHHYIDCCPQVIGSITTAGMASLRPVSTMAV